MPHQFAAPIWVFLFLVGLLLVGGRAISPPDLHSTEVAGKLAYDVFTALQDWESQSDHATAVPPTVTVVLTLASEATVVDLDLFRASADTVVVQGAFGRVVQLQVALNQIEKLAALERVRSIAFPPETLTNDVSWR
jgi:hypothetical protein